MHDRNYIAGRGPHFKYRALKPRNRKYVDQDLLRTFKKNREVYGQKKLCSSPLVRHLRSLHPVCFYVIPFWYLHRAKFCIVKVFMTICFPVNSTICIFGLTYGIISLYSLANPAASRRECTRYPFQKMNTNFSCLLAFVLHPPFISSNKPATL